MPLIVCCTAALTSLSHSVSYITFYFRSGVLHNVNLAQIKSNKVLMDNPIHTRKICPWQHYHGLENLGSSLLLKGLILLSTRHVISQKLVTVTIYNDQPWSIKFYICFEIRKESLGTRSDAACF